MKQLLLCLSLTLSLTSFSQIKVDDVGEGWKDSVNAAILKIKDSDPFYHVFLNANCNHISYTMAAFSTTEGDSTILISTRQMKAGYVNDIAATLVHESLHLYLKRLKLNLSEDEEELMCYRFELMFLFRVIDVEAWLMTHAITMINHYSAKLKLGDK
jgi:hypothetical protein